MGEFSKQGDREATTLPDIMHYESDIWAVARKVSKGGGQWRQRCQSVVSAKNQNLAVHEVLARG